MTKPLLSAFSEVVDVNRRWTPDWYSWLQSLSTGSTSDGDVIISSSEPSDPQLGQVWFNPDTNVLSIASNPSYAWSTKISAGNVAFSNSNLKAQRDDSVYLNTADTAGVKTVSLLPATQKYVFAIRTNMDLGGSSGFGLGDSRQTVGNGMFLGSTPAGIGYYPEDTDFYYWVNNGGGFGHSGAYPNGIYYVAVDPVGLLIWVRPIGLTIWNGTAADPVLGTGGVPLPTGFDVSTSRIVGQFFVNGDLQELDPAASGLGTLAGFTPLSEVVAWEAVKDTDNDWINIKDDYGAIGDGVADDGGSFQSFSRDYQGQNVVLYAPPGTYRSSSSNRLWAGIKQLTIFGYGASFGDSIDDFDALQNQNAYSTATSALVQSVFVGDTQLTLVNPGDASKFTDGDWILLGALDIQGDGIPPNQHHAEYIQVTSVSGGVVFLDNYVRGGPYLSTYPYYTDNSFGVNEGGPATIWKMPSSWDTDIYCYGVNFTSITGQQMILRSARNAYYRDCQWPGLQSNNWPNILAHKTLTLENCTIQGGGSIEVDKNIERLTFRNCNILGYYSALLFQSSSVQQLIIEGTNIVQLVGTPKNTYIKDSWIGILNTTPRSNGVSESVTIENSYIGSISFAGFASGFGGAEAISNYTFSNGTFSKAISPGAITWAAPGAKCVFMDATGFFRAPPYFTVLDVRGDGGAPGTGNVHVDTTLASVPTWANGTGPGVLPTLIGQHIFGNLTIKNCRGTRMKMLQQALDAPSDIGPGFQHGDLVLTGDSSTVTGNLNMKVEGTIVSITINVLRAYSGVNGAEALICENFDVYDNTFTDQNKVFSVDVKTAGIRSWSEGAWTGSVGADSLPVIAADDWLFGFMEWRFNNSMAGDTLSQTPLVSVEIVCDPGIIKFPFIDYKQSYLNS